MISIKEVECKTELQRGKGPVPSIGKGQKKTMNSFSENELSLQSRQDDGRSLDELIQNNVFSLPL